MEKFGPIIFTILLFIGGGFLVGKTLLGRPKGTADVSPSQCPPFNELQLTDEVRAYIDKELQSTQNAIVSNVNPSTLVTAVSDLEKKAADVEVVKNKSKVFMDKLFKYSKDLLDWDNTRQNRLDKDRVELGMDIMNEAVTKCGVQRYVYKPPKPGPKAAQPNPGASPPQPAPAK